MAKEKEKEDLEQEEEESLTDDEKAEEEEQETGSDDNEEKEDEEVEDSDDTSVKAEESKPESPVSERRASRAADKKAPPKSVVPMWVFVAFSVVLLAFIVALGVRNKFQMERIQEDKNKEINLLKKDKQELDEIINEKAGIIRGRDTKISELNFLIGNLKSDNSMQKEAMAKQKKIVDGLRDNLDKAHETLEEKKTDIETKTKNIADLQAKLTAAQTEKDSLKKKYTAADKELQKSLKQEKFNFVQMLSMKEERNKLQKKIEYYEKEKIPMLEHKIKELSPEEEKKEEGTEKKNEKK